MMVWEAVVGAGLPAIKSYDLPWVYYLRIFNLKNSQL